MADSTSQRSAAGAAEDAIVTTGHLLAGAEIEDRADADSRSNINNNSSSSSNNNSNHIIINNNNNDNVDNSIPDNQASASSSRATQNEKPVDRARSRDLSRQRSEEAAERRSISISNSDFEKTKGVSGSDEVDPFKVDFDGDDDPKNPRNWPTSRKASIIFVLSMLTLFTPLASSMFAPGIPQVLKEFDSQSQTLAGFVVSVFLLGYVAGPLFVAPIAEEYGRTYVYHVSNFLFIVFTVACALATSLNMLIGFRFLAGVSGVAPLVLGSGTIADLYPQEKRGGVMAIWSLGPLLGPVLGPICGGFITESIGWRWVFWIIAIAAGVIASAGLLVIKETYAPVLIDRKAKALRKSTGDERYQSILYVGDTPKEKFKKAIVRPLKMLFLSPIVFLMASYMAIVYGYLYLLFTTITEVFEQMYDFSSGVVGLSYLGIGIGLFIGLFAFGVVSDRAIKRQNTNGQPVPPEARLPPMIPGTLCVPIGLFWYGWSAQAQVHWIVPIIGTSFVGIGLIGTFMPIQTYVVDSYTRYAASVTAAITILRSLVGALLPLAGQPLYSALGLGWGNSLLGFIAVALIPTPLLFMKYGEWLRTSPRFKLEF